MEIKVKKLHDEAILPTKAHASDLGYDLYCLNLEKIVPIGDKFLIKVKTGISIQMPDNWGFIIKERSSLGIKGCEIRAGVVDPGYRGEIMVIMEIPHYMSIKKGDKIAQFIPIEAINFPIVEVSEFSGETDRGEKGFGSSGI